MDQQRLVELLRNEPANVWIENLRRYENGEPVTCRNAMLAVYEVALLNSEEQQDLEWVEVAVRAADLDARSESNVSAREGALYKAMRLRARYISTGGSRAGHPVLDREIVLRWILAGLTLAPEAASAMTATLWARLKAANQSPKTDNDQAYLDLIRLRRIKNRLKIAQMLFDSGELPTDSVIRAWLPIREILP